MWICPDYIINLINLCPALSNNSVGYGELNSRNKKYFIKIYYFQGTYLRFHKEASLSISFQLKLRLKWEVLIKVWDQSQTLIRTSHFNLIIGYQQWYEIWSVFRMFKIKRDDDVVNFVKMYMNMIKYQVKLLLEN